MASKTPGSPPAKRGSSEPQSTALVVREPRPEDKDPIDLEHSLEVAEEVLHNQVKDSTEGGACLFDHGGSTYSPQSCSYRWQSKEQAKDKHKHIFDNASESLASHPKAGESIPASHKRIWYAGANDILPQHEDDWKVEGPNRPPTDLRKDNRGKEIPNGENFQNAQWPFWNNAHHLIPKGTVKKYYTGGSVAARLMRCSLLRAKWNVHHKVNMMILPMDGGVGRVLFLPRHLGMIKQSDSFNHPDYNKMVKSKLEEIFDEYKQTVDQAISGAEVHEVPKADLDKQKLDGLSRRLYLHVKKWGAVAEGSQIDLMEGQT